MKGIWKEWSTGRRGGRREGRNGKGEGGKGTGKNMGERKSSLGMKGKERTERVNSLSLFSLPTH